jgi:hypothetical protein
MAFLNFSKQMELLDLPMTSDETMKRRQSWAISTETLPNGSANATSTETSRRNSPVEHERRSSFEQKPTRPCFAVAQIENSSSPSVQVTVEDRHIHL